MNRETRKALERLEAQLLEIEEEQQVMTEEERLDALLQEFLDEPDEEEAPAPQTRAVYRNYSNDYGKTRVIQTPKKYQAYNTDVSDEDLDTYSDEVYEEAPPEKLSGLIITAAALLLANAGVLLWWAFRLL